MSDRLHGYYKARANEKTAQLGQNEKGNDQIVLDMEIVEGEHKGRSVQTFLYFTPAAGPFSLERLRACGWNNTQDLAGVGKNIVTIEVKYEQYNGREQMKVDIVTGGGRFELKQQMGDAQKRAFFSNLIDMSKRASSPPSDEDRVPFDDPPPAGSKLAL